MNVPAIAKKSFDLLRDKPEFMSIVQGILSILQKLPLPQKRAKFVHQMVDEFNQDVFSHPLVKKLSPCQSGCSACCHTQVSVTDEEAELLIDRIAGGVEIDTDRLERQMRAEDSTENFYKLNFLERRCIFLDDRGACKVYDDRPSVCRTNAVLGSADQCDTSQSLRPTRLVLTQKADMVIYASFLFSAKSGSLPHMIGKKILKEESKVS
jgi:Fe-S-cluster containining protein